MGRLLARCPVAGATTGSHLLTGADDGYQIEVAITASNAGGRSLPATSAPTAAVTPPPPVATGPVVISGPAGGVAGQLARLVAAVADGLRHPVAALRLGRLQMHRGPLRRRRRPGSTVVRTLHLH